MCFFFSGSLCFLCFLLFLCFFFFCFLVEPVEEAEPEEEGALRFFDWSTRGDWNAESS